LLFYIFDISVVYFGLVLSALKLDSIFMYLYE